MSAAKEGNYLLTFQFGEGGRHFVVGVYTSQKKAKDVAAQLQAAEVKGPEPQVFHVWRHLPIPKN